MENSVLKQAFEIASNDDVLTSENGAVVYSVSFLETKENQRLAYEYEKKHPNCFTLDHTPCGRKLADLGLLVSKDVADEDIQKVWELASARFIEQASGDVTAFVDGADKKSTFCSVEAEHILKNPKIKTVNHLEKEIFLRAFLSND